MSDSNVLTISVDGREYGYEINQTDIGMGLTPREWGVLKRLAKIPGPASFVEGIGALDLELIAALAVVLMTRAGQPVDEGLMFDGKYKLELRFDEADAVDPPGGVEADDALVVRRSRTSKTPARIGAQS